MDVQFKNCYKGGGFTEILTGVRYVYLKVVEAYEC